MIVYGVIYSLPQDQPAEDVAIFLASGRAIAEGTDPYNASEFPNFNPPISLPIFQLISYLDPIRVSKVWYTVSLLLYMVIMLLLAKTYPSTPLKFVWALSLSGLWITLHQGQIYIPLVLLAVLAWLALRGKKHVLAGIFIGLLIAIKPNFIVWSLLLLVAGFPIVTLASFISAGLVSLIPLVLYSPKVYLQWLGANGEVLSLTKAPANSSIMGLLARMDLLILSPILIGLIILGLVLIIRRSRASVMDTSTLGLIGSLILSPLAWAGYTLVLLPIFFSRSWTPMLYLTGILLVLPYLLLGSPVLDANLLTLGSMYSYTLLIILAYFGSLMLATKSNLLRWLY